MRLAIALTTSPLAPTNLLLGNPPPLNRAFDTVGASLAHGALNPLHDLCHNQGMPAQVDTAGEAHGKVVISV